jgi:hypothetical protein
MFAYRINQIAIDLLRQKLKILEKVYLRFGSKIFLLFQVHAHRDHIICLAGIARTLTFTPRYWSPTLLRRNCRRPRHHYSVVTYGTKISGSHIETKVIIRSCSRFQLPARNLTNFQS